MDNSMHLYEEKWDENIYSLNETLFAQGNGYLGLRGSFEEAFRTKRIGSIRGTFINGFYENEKILYGESAYGFAKTNQIMLNIPDATRCDFDFDGELFSMDTGTVISYRRELDMSEGILCRDVVWQSDSGKRIRINFKRMVALFDPHLLLLKISIIPENFNGILRFSSHIDANVTNIRNADDPRVGSQSEGYAFDITEHSVYSSNGLGLLSAKTHRSNLVLGCSIHHAVLHENNVIPTSSFKDRLLSLCYVLPVVQGKETVIEKVACYTTSQETPFGEMPLLLREKGALTLHEGFDACALYQKERLTNYWKVARVSVENKPEIEKALSFNQYHLLQSAGKDGKRNVASKGLTGEGYGGHYFWDTEIYMIPFFLFRQPDIARKLLEHRYTLLPHARNRARTMGHSKGALYPWRTIAGEECSAYYPAGTAQYHINADIAYAIKQYYEITQDSDFIVKKGAEIVLETARIWSDLGHFNPEKNGQFTIEGVTGPDEYTAVVDNNYYTNRMALEHLRFAIDVLKILELDFREAYKRIRCSLSLSDEEIDRWERITRSMYLPACGKNRVTPQDDSFFTKKTWDFRHTPTDQYPLLLHFHPLVIYRHQVCKQADVLMAHYLVGDTVSREQKKRDFDYYEPITTHDSSLSPCIHGIIAAEIGYMEKAEEYFSHTVFLDLHNLHRNTVDGAHLASMAGSWMTFVFGFGGLRIVNGTLSFNPVLPASWSAYSFRLRYRRALLSINIAKAAITYSLLEGEAVLFSHKNKTISLTKQNPEIALQL
jgi:alpha,alpha-trehalose phosphorylase